MPLPAPLGFAPPCPSPRVSGVDAVRRRVFRRVVRRKWGPTALSVAKSIPNINFLIKQLLLHFRLELFSLHSASTPCSTHPPLTYARRTCQTPSPPSPPPPPPTLPPTPHPPPPPPPLNKKLIFGALSATLGARGRRTSSTVRREGRARRAPTATEAGRDRIRRRPGPRGRRDRRAASAPSAPRDRTDRPGPRDRSASRGGRGMTATTGRR